MSFLSRLTATLQSWTKPPFELPAPLYPEARTELAFLVRLAADRSLDATFQAFRLRQEDVQSHLAKQVDQNGVESEKVLARVRAGALAAATGSVGKAADEPSKQEDHLAFLITFGSGEVRRLFAGLGVDPGAVVFWLAHRTHESDLRSNWPNVRDRISSVTVVNDPYSPMELVRRSLAEAFGLPDDKAIEVMLQVHEQGSATLDVPKHGEPISFCEACNRQWRSSGIPLYVRPTDVAASDA